MQLAEDGGAEAENSSLPITDVKTDSTFAEMGNSQLSVTGTKADIAWTEMENSRLTEAALADSVQKNADFSVGLSQFFNLSNFIENSVLSDNSAAVDLQTQNNLEQTVSIQTGKNAVIFSAAIWLTGMGFILLSESVLYPSSFSYGDIRHVHRIYTSN